MRGVEIAVHVIFGLLLLAVGGWVLGAGSMVEMAALVFGVAWMMVYTQVMDQLCINHKP